MGGLLVSLEQKKESVMKKAITDYINEVYRFRHISDVVGVEILVSGFNGARMNAAATITYRRYSSPKNQKMYVVVRFYGQDIASYVENKGTKKQAIESANDLISYKIDVSDDVDAQVLQFKSA